MNKTIHRGKCLKEDKHRNKRNDQEYRNSKGYLKKRQHLNLNEKKSGQIYDREKYLKEEKQERKK